MFLHTQAPQDAPDHGGEHQEQCVEWDDDGLQQQLLEKLNKSHNSTPARGTLSNSKGISRRQQAQHGAAQNSRQQALLAPPGLDRDSSPPPHTSQDTPRVGVHDLLDELLTQAQRTAADDLTTAAQQQPARTGAHLQDDQGQVQQEQQMPSQAQLLGQQQQVSHTPGSVAGASSRVNSKQLLANLLQTPQHPPQRHSQLPPAAAAPQHPAAPAGAAKQHGKQQKGSRYSTTSARSHSNTPLGRPSSTPQTRPAAKKKPRFSIKDTPPPSAQALVTPQAKGRSTSAAAAAAVPGSGSSAASLAALLGGAAATPNRQQQPDTKADTSSRTPVQHSMGGGMAGLFATPRHSSSKPPAQPRAAGQAAAVTGDGAAAAMPAAGGGGQAADTPAAGGTEAVTPVTGSKRRASAVNPLEVMSASRQRQRAFLDRLPAGPTAAAAAAAGGGGGAAGGAGSGAVLPGMQLAGVRVPLGASLSKVWQQLQEVRKKQQDRLEENPESDAGALELEVHSKSWEAHLVKCSCTVTKCPPPTAQTQQQQSQRQTQAQPAVTQQQQQQQQQPAVGDKVFVLVNSKAGHYVELRPGSRVRLHTPWHVMAPQQPGKPMVLLGYFMS